MSTVEFIEAFAKPERLSVRTQTKITPSEKELLDEFVDYCRSHGLEVTPSSAQRTFIVNGLRAWREELGRASLDPRS